MESHSMFENRDLALVQRSGLLLGRGPARPCLNPSWLPAGVGPRALRFLGKCEGCGTASTTQKSGRNVEDPCSLRPNFVPSRCDGDGVVLAEGWTWTSGTPHMHDRLVFGGGAGIVQWRKNSIFSKWCRDNWVLRAKGRVGPHHAPCGKGNSKRVKPRRRGRNSASGERPQSRICATSGAKGPGDKRKKRSKFCHLNYWTACKLKLGGVRGHRQESKR